VSELLYKEEIFQLVVFAWKFIASWERHDEVIYKDALVIEPSRAGIPFSRGENTKSHTKELSCLIITTRTSLSGKILFEAKAVEKLADSHIKQVLNYLARLETFASACWSFRWRCLERKRVIL